MTPNTSGGPGTPARGRRARRAGLALLAALSTIAAGGIAAALTQRGEDRQAAAPAAVSSRPASPYRGTALDGAVTLPDVTLTDTHRRPYRLADPHGSALTLVYFGYTHCPDVCPTTMADVALALQRLPADARGKVRVVMVSSDPARDTPQQLGTWLDSIDPSFEGLTGDLEVIIKAAESVGVPIEAPVQDANGEYEVTHGTQLIAFDAAGKAQALWTSGFPPGDLVHDLPLLLAKAGATPGTPPASSPADAIVVTDPWVRQPIIPTMTGGYLVVTNNADTPDKLLSVSSAAAGEVQTHETVSMNGAAMMRRVDGFAVPAHGELVLEPGGKHLMLMQPRAGLKPGQLVRFTLTFAQAGKVVVVAPVRSGTTPDEGDAGHTGHGS